ncbi:Asp-tRNA(Asn)/Glu-tRNA(Gln) amidotransferase subunit GatA [Patescibacteria group bacterium]|nr:Asp-tRNA(Asn)/Glu-tRNA(Gln) amidotransferase subunit GatA [Patescibacteria group bacterium]
MNKLNQLSLSQARKGLREKKFSSVELTRSCLQQIDKTNKQINAFITLDETSLSQAKKADEKIASGDDSSLLGIPIALKDLFLTKGLRTTAASKVLEDYIPVYDATVVGKLKESGVVILGKLNHDAWGHGASGENTNFGPTKNPWNKDYVPGGSSSGSAASVSSDMCIAATGTDTGGSSRLPAAFCNVVGLKPTYGRVSRYGIIAMSSSLDSIGHLTKTVEDSALFLNVTAGTDPKDSTTPNVSVPDYTKSLGKSIKGVKIGIPKEYTTEVGGLDIEILTLFEKTLKELRKLGAEIKDISLKHTKHANACYYVIQPAEVSSNLARYDGIRYGNTRETFAEEAKRRIMLGTFTLSAGYYDAYYKKAMQVRTLIKEDFDKAFKEVDVIITPVSPTPPWKIGEKINDPLKMYLSDIFTVTANLAGIPGISIPSGFTRSNLPTGIQILGPQFSEERLFQTGYAYEQSTRFFERKPDL